MKFWSHMRIQPTRSSRIYIFALIFGAYALAGGAEGWWAWRARQVAFQEDATETSNLARSLAQHAHDNIGAAIAILSGVRERLEKAGLDCASKPEIHALLASYVQQLPILAGVFVYDQNGNWIVNSRSVTPSQVLNNSDRSYFKYHKDHQDREAYLSDPIRSRSTGAWILPISVKLDDREGKFAGVILATLSVDSFQKFYRTFDPESEGVIAMVSADGIMIARNPPDNRFIGTDVSTGGVFRVLKAGRISQSFEYRAIVDNVKRFGSAQRVPDYPLIVVVAHGISSILALWWEDTIRNVLGVVLGLVALSFVALTGAKHIQRGEEAERRYRLLADYSGDAIICGMNTGERFYASPALAAMTGWGEQESLRLPWSAVVHDDDQAAFQSAIERVRRVQGPVTVAFRYRCRGGHYLWVEAQIKQAPLGQGGESQMIFNIRDIALRKAAEEQIAQLNRELEVLARQDELTTLSNRRQFDAMVSGEWARAAREGSELSLCMIDVDRFKFYNDRYGHLQGDRCLRLVADAIASVARRPADVPARYGGEEFALLLPRTAGAGALQLAERVCVAVASADIEHQGNEPWGRVTVSIGVATVAPDRDIRHNPSILIGLADKALYEAKHLGRNQVCQSGPNGVMHPNPDDGHYLANMSTPSGSLGSSCEPTES